MFIKKELKVLTPIILLLGIYVYLADPLKGPILPCVFYKATGFYCPGCGMSRAAHYIFHFNFKEALRYNALIFIIPPLIIAYYYIKHKEKEPLEKALIFLMLAIVIGFGIIRNICLPSF